ncbi:hypothetical protein LUTEI9C_70390 [Luteimonas sp. 9C]|nr:hypothetical protein LUTEI9C_70390 [Luteimonas sp. 9C]
MADSAQHNSTWVDFIRTPCRTCLRSLAGAQARRTLHPRPTAALRKMHAATLGHAGPDARRRHVRQP